MNRKISELFKRFSPLVFSVSISILRNRQDAEDVVQEVFAHRLRTLLLERSERSLEEWGKILTVVSRNCAIDEYRRRIKHSTTDYNEDTPVDDCTNRDLSFEMTRLIESLQPRYKEVLTLKYVWQFTWQEISKKLGISEQGARKRASVAIREARKKSKDRT